LRKVVSGQKVSSQELGPGDLEKVRKFMEKVTSPGGESCPVCEHHVFFIGSGKISFAGAWYIIIRCGKCGGASFHAADTVLKEVEGPKPPLKYSAETPPESPKRKNRRGRREERGSGRSVIIECLKRKSCTTRELGKAIREVRLQEGRDHFVLNVEKLTQYAGRLLSALKREGKYNVVDTANGCKIIPWGPIDPNKRSNVKRATYPLRTCQGRGNPHCIICETKIRVGHRYYDAGAGRQAHYSCAAQEGGGQ